MSHARAEQPELSLAEYDELPYDCLPFPQTHPSRLAALARLFGIEAPSVETCRVLELGCGNGNNLIPMAAALPGARFTGIDLSAGQIATGRTSIAAAGLTNIELRHADIASVDHRDGTFDYIIAHGVYSWVPPEVRDRVMAIARANLAPNGVAYVSYNTLPGWATTGTLRDMMMFQARDVDDPADRLRAGRELLDFFAQSIPESPYGSLAREEIAFLKQQPDEYVSHDHMGEFNTPVYFHQFAAHAAQHRLQYLCEAELSMMVLGGLAPATVAAMRKLAKGIVPFEQLTDILRHRAFRQTLLVHESAKVDRRIGPHSIAPFAIASSVTVATPHSATPPNAPMVFVARNGNRFGISNALTRAALLHLIERWPESVPFAELSEVARRSLTPASSIGVAGGHEHGGPETLATELLQLCASGIAELRLWNPNLSATVSDRPMVSPLARLQARRGSELTTLLHHSLRLDAFERALVPLLDGNRDMPALAEALEVNGVTAAWRSANPALNGADVSVALRNSLSRLAKAGALMKDRWSRQASRVATATYAALGCLLALECELV